MLITGPRFRGKLKGVAHVWVNKGVTSRVRSEWLMLTTAIAQRPLPWSLTVTVSPSRTLVINAVIKSSFLRRVAAVKFCRRVYVGNE
jgi:hypothetical protein